MGEWRKRSDLGRGRRRALKEEIGYWTDWLDTSGGKYPDDYAYRFDPDAEVADPALRAVLAQLEDKEVSILDVGAGPATTVGRRFPGLALTVVAVDPLADAFSRLLAKAGAVPPVPTRRVAGESLVEHFGRNRFDVAYARNAIDHTVDPLLVVQQMLTVVRPGGYVVLRHVRNEGEKRAYDQLHQWNFDERDGRLVVWRRGQETDVAHALADRADVACHRESDEDWIVCTIRKRASV